MAKYNPTKAEVKARIINACDNGDSVYKGSIYKGIEELELISDLVWCINLVAPDYDFEDFNEYLNIGLVDELCKEHRKDNDGGVKLQAHYLRRLKEELLTCLEFCTTFNHA